LLPPSRGMHPKTDDADAPTGDVELEDRLADAHAAVLAREVERKRAHDELPPRKPRAEARWVAAASMAWLLVALTLISPPQFLRGAQPRPFELPAALAEPSMRYGVWLAQHRVAGFAKREGRLPSFLGEAGMHDSTITYAVTGESSYRLSVTLGDRTVQFVSGMSADSFVGTSIRQLQAEP
jgi:hypothetical protein